MTNPLDEDRARAEYQARLLQSLRANAEDRARSDYARWFVREHFLRKEYDEWQRHFSTDIKVYDRIRNNGGVTETIWTDLNQDKPPRDQGHQSQIDWQCFQPVRRVGEGRNLYLWLLTEAEYFRVLNEALVRSYDADVMAP